MLLICAVLGAAPNEKLVAEWDFGKRTDADVAGKFTGGKVRGNSRIVDGWLTMSSGHDDKAEGFITSDKPYPELTPDGGFRIEVVAKVDAKRNSTNRYVLADTKYFLDGYKISDPQRGRGFMFTLMNAGVTEDSFSLQALLGFNDVVHVFYAPMFQIDLEKEHTFALEYDGMTTGRIFVDGVEKGRASFEGGPLAKPNYPLVIGDRFGSTQYRFCGKIRNVRLYSFPPQVVRLLRKSRLSFVRGESDTTCSFIVWNPSDETLKNVKAEITIDGKTIQQDIGDIAAKSRTTMAFRGPEATQVSEHPLKVLISAQTKEGLITDEFSGKYRIGPQMPPDDFPVLLWNAGELDPGIDTCLEYGVTLDLFRADYYGLDGRDIDIVQGNVNPLLDDYIAKGLRRAGSYGFGHNGDETRKYPRYDRAGKPVVKNIEASNPDYKKRSDEVAEKAAKVFSGNPAFGVLLINSEVRDSSMPSFGKYEPAAFEKYAGYPIPETVVARAYQPYWTIDGFPFSRIVPDDDKILTFYRWYWSQGDGWNNVHSGVNQQFHKYIKGPFWTFYDPAVRVPPVWGSGGDVDVISQWTYAYPDPIKASVATDELFAMAKGHPGQKVMSMTQIICYRNQTAPVEVKVDNEPDWVKESPKGPFISIPPDSLRASIWSIISRPVQGIMFHGAASCWGRPGDKGYVTTNPDTKVMFKKVINGVVKPLGPTLKRIPDRPHEVAILESFASTVYAHRGSWGWGGSWVADSNLMLQWAHLSPSVIYEEEILRDGFGDLKVLCLFDCDVLTEGVFRKIQEFQEKGGIVVADENVSPLIVADVAIRRYIRGGPAKECKEALQKISSELRKKLDATYRPYADSDNLDFVTRVRTYKNADYLFVINDKRTYGDYLGPWRNTMEKGLPNSGTVTMKRKSAVVYDLVAHRKVNFSVVNGETIIPLVFDTNDGRLLLAMDSEIEKVNCDVKQNGKVCSSVKLTGTILDKKGKVIDALIPIHINIYAPDGKLLDGSGAACAVGGKIDFDFKTTPQAGKWRVEVKELASEKSGVVTFKQR